MNQRPFERVLLIVNPRSGGARTGRWAERVAEGFRSAGCEVDMVLTRQAGDGRAAASRARDGDLVAAFGGDGTMNEVLNGADLGRVTLAVVPAGTGNVLAKELGMSCRPLRAVRQICSGRAVPFDVGLCNGRRFLCMFGAGFDAHIARLIHAQRGGGLSQWHYVPHVVRCILRPAPWQISVEVDGRSFAEGAYQVSVGNTRSFGGPIEMTPAARPDDGLLDVMCAERKNVLDGVRLLALCWLRRLDRSRMAHYVRGRRVAVTAPQSGVPYQVDGEAAGCLPAAVTLSAAAARVIVPAE